VSWGGTAAQLVRPRTFDTRQKEEDGATTHITTEKKKMQSDITIKSLKYHPPLTAGRAERTRNEEQRFVFTGLGYCIN